MCFHFLFPPFPPLPPPIFQSKVLPIWLRSFFSFFSLFFPSWCFPLSLSLLGGRMTGPFPSLSPPPPNLACRAYILLGNMSFFFLCSGLPDPSAFFFPHHRFLFPFLSSQIFFLAFDLGIGWTYVTPFSPLRTIDSVPSPQFSELESLVRKAVLIPPEPFSPSSFPIPASNGPGWLRSVGVSLLVALEDWDSPSFELARPV